MVRHHASAAEKRYQRRLSVQNYNASTATLELVHSATTPGKNTVVYVDITAVLETVKHTELEVGAWINVVGYLVKVPRKASDSKHSRSVPRHAYVQAIMLWSAGSVKLDEYEASVKQFQQAIPN